MNTRAIEAGALAMLRWMHGQQATFNHFAPGIKAGLLEQAEECITAYEAHLKAEGFVVVPRDDDTRDHADSALPPSMVIAGSGALEKCHDDLRDYVSGITPDWDNGMIAVAVYRAMLSAATTGENDASD